MKMSRDERERGTVRRKEAEEDSGNEAKEHKMR